MVGMFLSKIYVCQADLFDALHRIGNLRQPDQRVRQTAKVLVTDLAEEFVLVGEVPINRGRGVLDLVGNIAHRNTVIPSGDEQLAGRIENALTRLQPFPFPPLLYSHNTNPLVNVVILTPLTYSSALSMSRGIL